MAETKAQKAAKARKLQTAPAVTQFKIPAEYDYAMSPLKLASDPSGLSGTPNAVLEAALVGDDFIAVRNEGCDDTFVIAKSTLAELMEAAG